MANSRSRRSPDLPSALAGALADAGVSPGDRLLIGLSGGLDSMVLLHALHRIGHWALCAHHVHHGISARASEWAEFCRVQAAARAVAFDLSHVTLCRDTPHGLEAEARDARYAALRSRAAREAIGWLLTAHHADDQAETLLHHLVRGAGVQGLAGMAPRQVLGDVGPIQLRPMLALTRAEILAYAQDEGLQWVDDESNADTYYARNYVRAHVLPPLVRRWPRAVESLAGAARRLAEAQRILDDMAQQDVQLPDHAPALGWSIDLAGLCRLPAYRARNALRYFLRRAGLTNAPAERRLDEWLRQLLQSANEHECMQSFDTLVACAYHGRLFLVPAFDPPTRQTCAESMQWGRASLRLRQAHGEGLRADLLACAQVRVRGEGDRFRRWLNGRSMSLKNLFQQSGLPPYLRARMPLIEIEGEIAWVAGQGVAEGFRAGPGATGWVPEFELFPR